MNPRIPLEFWFSRPNRTNFIDIIIPPIEKIVPNHSKTVSSKKSIESTEPDSKKLKTVTSL